MLDITRLSSRNRIWTTWNYNKSPTWHKGTLRWWSNSSNHLLPWWLLWDCDDSAHRHGFERFGTLGYQAVAYRSIFCVTHSSYNEHQNPLTNHKSFLGCVYHENHCNIWYYMLFWYMDPMMSKLTSNMIELSTFHPKFGLITADHPSRRWSWKIPWRAMIICEWQSFHTLSYRYLHYV